LVGIYEVLLYIAPEVLRRKAICQTTNSFFKNQKKKVKEFMRFVNKFYVVSAV